MPKSFNLDTGVEEYFEFIIFGGQYKFRYPNTEEITKWSELANSKDENKLMDLLKEFITPVGDAQPFEEAQKKMLVPHLVKFREMIFEALGIKGADINADN